VGVAVIWDGRERGVAPGCRALGLLLEGDAEEPLRLVQPLIGLWVRRVRDVFQVAGGGERSLFGFGN
jgi:hypothetical protein